MTSSDVSETPAESGETDAAIAELEEQMTILAGHVRVGMRDMAVAIDPALQPFGLKVLQTLARCGPTRASDTAEALFVDRSVISRQARQLEELGLIDVQVDPDDGRARFLAITPLAVQRLAAARTVSQVLSRERLSTWPVRDLHQFAAYIARLNSPVVPPAVATATAK